MDATEAHDLAATVPEAHAIPTAEFLMDARAVMAAIVMRRFLYGLSPFDPMAYALVAGVLIVAAGLATWVPARRAVRVDPAVTLRGE